MTYHLATPAPETIDLGFVQLGWFKVLILGIVQGITELLPISSTAHMRIVPSLLGWPDPGSAFSAAMQMASLGAVLSYPNELHALFKAGLDANGWFVLLVGLTSASTSAFLAIYGLFRYLESQSTWIFVWYRLAIGLFLIVGSLQGFLH